MEDLIKQDGDELKSYLCAYPNMLFKNGLIQNVSDATFEWIQRTFEYMEDALAPLVQQRNGEHHFFVYEFRYILEYKGVQAALDYVTLTQPEQLNMSELKLASTDGNIESMKFIKNAFEFIEQYGQCPEIDVPLNDEEAQDLVQTGVSIDAQSYLVCYGLLKQQYDIFYPNHNMPIRNMIMDIDDMEFLESRGYKNFVNILSVHELCDFDVAERTGYPPNFCKELKASDPKLYEKARSLDVLGKLIEELDPIPTIQRLGGMARVRMIKQVRAASRSRSPTRVRSPVKHKM